MDTNNNPSAVIGRMDKGRKLLVLGVILVILVGLVWYFGSGPKTAVSPGGAESGAGVAPGASVGIGSSLYPTAQSPADKLPATVAPAPNPIQGMYQNPF